MIDRSSFGPELRRAREARGLTLDEIAEQTKVSATLYRGLENNDLSRWPSGLFRRAFVRSYAEAVGLDPEETCRRFVRLFPEDGGSVPEMHAVPPPTSPVQPAAPPAPAAEAPRLLLATAPTQNDRRSSLGRRLAAAALDLSLAGIPAAAAGLLAGAWWFWSVAVLVAAVGHLVSLTIAGRTPGALLLLGEAERAQKAEDLAQEARRRAEVEGPVLVASRRQPGRNPRAARSGARRR